MAYDVACRVATENLQVGVPVVVDGVHATHALRLLWRRVSDISHTRLIQIEITLSDEVEHRRRVREREATGYVGPTWEQIRDMDYDAWNEAIDGRRLAVDAHDTDRALVRCLTHVTGPDRGRPDLIPGVAP